MATEIDELNRFLNPKNIEVIHKMDNMKNIGSYYYSKESIYSANSKLSDSEPYKRPLLIKCGTVNILKEEVNILFQNSMTYV